VIQTPNTLTDQKIQSMDIKKPMANSYPAASALSAQAAMNQSVMLGHNAFRPDIYRVTQGVVS
jgi:hypothetical protein